MCINTQKSHKLFIIYHTVIMSVTPKSEVLQHFEKVKNGTAVICNLCKKEYKYNGATGTMWIHLGQAHDIQNPKSARKYVPATKSVQWSLMSMFEEKKPYDFTAAKHIQITRKIVEYVVKDMHPVSSVTTDACEEVLRVLDPR